MLEPEDFTAAAEKVPGTSTVTLFPSSPPGVPIPIAGARKRPVSRRELLAMNLELNVQACVWILPASQLNGYVPMPADKLQDGCSVNWVLKNATEGLMATEYKCLSTKGRA